MMMGNTIPDSGRINLFGNHAPLTVENFVGIKLAMANRTDYALSVILQSPVQIALFLLS